MKRNLIKERRWLALLIPLAMLALMQPASAQAPQPKEQPKEISAAPGMSGGEGGGFGRDVTLEPATKENPFLKTTVGQPTGAPQGDDATSNCLRMAYKDFTDIPGAPTSITGVTVKASMDNGPMICQVEGYVNPQVAFRLLLPLDTWNEKYMQNGCGGACSTFIAIPCEVQVKRGYACMAPDMGHKGTTYDNVWAIEDLQAQIDRSWRSTHVAALAGKEITARYYGKKAKYAYYHGASTGGGQGVTEAVLFPTDFDGIVSGEPIGVGRFNPPTRGGPQGGPGGGGGGRGNSLIGPDGKLLIKTADLKVLHKGVLAQCDALDFLADGLITDPRECKFKASSMLCKGPKTPECFSEAQVAAIDSIYRDGRGQQLGSELAWGGRLIAADDSGTANTREPAKVRSSSSYAGGGGPPNPNLQAFKASGGKFIFYMGWADETIDPIGPLQYYEMLERTMGGRAATQDFFRYFMIPGQSHIPGNAGAESLDYIVALEDWVEKGIAPDRLVGHKLKWISQMMGPMYLPKDLVPENYLYSRPLYPYPLQARYLGKGDPDKAESFGPWDPATKKFVAMK